MIVLLATSKQNNKAKTLLATNELSEARDRRTVFSIGAKQIYTCAKSSESWGRSSIYYLLYY